MVRRINQTIHLEQTREEVYNRAIKVQENIKNLFDKRTKAVDFKIGDKVLKWDSRREDKGKNNKLVHALWADRLTTKKSIGMSPFQLVYGAKAVFPTSLGVPVIKLVQEIQTEEDSMVRRINQTIHRQQTREEVYNRAIRV